MCFSIYLSKEVHFLQGLEGFKKTTILKDSYPHLTVTLAIGGWNEGSMKYSEMASDPSKREIFVSSVIQFLRMHNFDGLDIDWEYPGKHFINFLIVLLGNLGKPYCKSIRSTGVENVNYNLLLEPVWYSDSFFASG